jgi:long-chain acyl-CoA synthetase
MNFVQELPEEEGVLLVQKVKQLGAKARETYASIAQHTRQIAHKHIQELEEYKTEQQQQIHQQVSLNNIDIQRVFESFEQLKNGLNEKRNEIEQLRANPIGIETFHQVVSEFTETLGKLLEYGKKHNVKIPWQITQCCEMDPDSTNPVVEFDGGRVLDPDGNNVLGAMCYCCGDEIQDGAKGEGAIRYKCIDCSTNISQCSSCHNIKSKLKNCLSDDFIEQMEQLDPHWNHTQCEQNNIDSFLRFPIPEAPTLSLSLHNALSVYSSRPAFGLRDNSSDKINWIKYSEVREKSIQLGIAIKKLLEHESSKVVGICSQNRPEWVYMDFACVYNGYMTVGVHIPWPLEDIEFIINNAEISCVVCEEETIHKYLAVANKCPSLKHIVLMDDKSIHYEKEQQLNITDYKTILSTVEINDTTESGISLLTPITTKIIRPIDTTVPFSLMYSSGTSGKPKGIIVTQQGYKLDNLHHANFNTPNVLVSYSALGHGMGRGLIWQSISNGGRIVFCPRESQLIEYSKRVEPTILVAFPQFWNMLYADYIRNNSNSEQFNNILGSRLQVVGTGGSTIAPDVIQFMRNIFPNAQIVNSYGLTEIPGISNNGIIRPDVSLKLRDVPSMDYYARESRGEILVKSNSMTPGYYRLPDQTKLLFDDEEGYICTGDIGSIDEQGLLHIIDRVTNFIEIDIDGANIWIAGSDLESKLLESKYIDQIYVHGDRIESSLIAVVVVSDDKQQDKNIILQDLKRITELYQLPYYYAPKAIVIETVPWTVDNGSLTVNSKVRRYQLQQRYKTLIDIEYGKLSLGQ